VLLKTLHKQVTQLAIIFCFFLTVCIPAPEVEAIMTPPTSTSRQYARSVASTDEIKKQFSQALNQFTSSRGFPGAVISIYKDGAPVMNQAYGICNVDGIYPIASLSKLFTEVATKQLIHQKVITPDTRVYEYLELNIPVKDKRIKDITVRQLLEHQGGWDRSRTGDPLFQLDLMFPSLDSRKIPPETFLKFVFRNFKLDHQPGTKNSYCNFGYFLLGMVVEKATQQTYVDHINSNYANPNDFMLYQGTTPRGKPSQDTFSLELSGSSFGLAAKISDIGLFFSKYDRNGFQKNEQNKDRMQWWKDGSLPEGTSLMLRHRKNDVVVVVYIPDRDENNWENDNIALKNLIDNTANSLGL
jgi:hypothetical protein